MPPAVRAVLDTNLLLRALLSASGPAARLLGFAEAGAFELVLSPAIVRELRAGFFKPHVRKRYPLPIEAVAAYLASLRAVAHVVPGAVTVQGVSPDPADDAVLACAVEAGAGYLVTDDRRDLLPLKHYQRVQIVSAPAFLRILGRR